MLDLTLIGHGAIAQYVMKALAGDPTARVSQIVMRAPRVAEVQAAAGAGVKVVASADELTHTPGFAIEVAGHAGLHEHGVALLSKGIDLLVVSVGALADRGLYDTLSKAAEAGGAKMIIAPGAVGGIDALAAARQGGLTGVRYTSRKPPLAWKGTPGEQVCDLDALTEAATLFEGRADEAARLYPKNANVAATIALAGAGWDRTQVRVVADPAAPGNVHEVEAEGAFGRMTVRMEGKPLPGNPKTSSLTAFSVLRAIRNRASAVEI
ncbi:MAG: aspartate dehydrogenase [Bauldia litoralis]